MEDASRRTFMRSSLHAIALSAIVALMTCGDAVAQKPGGTLVQITQPEPPNLAPYISTAGPIGQVTAKIFDGLLEYDFNLKPQPGLAESFVVAPDGKTVTFKLRRGVTSTTASLLRRPTFSSRSWKR